MLPPRLHPQLCIVKKTIYFYLPLKRFKHIKPFRDNKGLKLLIKLMLIVGFNRKRF